MIPKWLSELPQTEKRTALLSPYLHLSFPSYSWALKSTMSSLEMVLAPRLSYQRLRNEGGFDDYIENREERALRRRIRSRYRFKIGRRFNKVKIPNLRRFLRRKARVAAVSWTKIVKRLKESRSHFGDLFAGNYMFMQVSPTPLAKCLDKKRPDKPNLGHEVYGLSSNYSIENRILYH